MPSSRRDAKLQSRQSLATIAARLKRQGRRLVFTNGCFDLVHVGHAALLEQAKRLGDVLIVGLNSDRSVRALKKGPGRPLVPQQARAKLLAALAAVDYVTIFDEPTPYELIRAIKPDILVKGADWGPANIVGQDLVGRVVRIKLVSGFSTTTLIERIVRAHGRR